MTEEQDRIIENLKDFQNALNGILIGKQEVVEKITACIIAGANILLEDMPGVGKTVISKALALLIMNNNGQPITFSRIQGTPDLLPYDITGVDMYNPQTNQFSFHAGPIFTDILLADELNRATPKVQSALLEAMAEKQVTVGGKTYPLSPMFSVIATQNPIETEGTYPLPAAQLDRFACQLRIGYPDPLHEAEIIKRGRSENRLSALQPVITADEILTLRSSLVTVEFSDKLTGALTAVADKTRKIKELKSGLSTRALLSLVEVARAYASLRGRQYVTDQDIIDLGREVLAHRLIPAHPHINTGELIDKIVREETRKALQ